jgi:hypothetical protein
MGRPNKRSFEDTYNDKVKEMTRNLVNYVKSLRDSGADVFGQESGNCTNSQSGPDITMSPDGFPVLLASINQKQFTKRELEDAMRAYLGQHYCR